VVPAAYLFAIPQKHMSSCDLTSTPWCSTVIAKNRCVKKCCRLHFQAFHATASLRKALQRHNFVLQVEPTQTARFASVGLLAGFSCHRIRFLLAW